MVWDPQKPEISLLDPPMDPILADLCAKRPDLGSKITFLSNMYVGSESVPEGPKWPPKPYWALAGLF